MERTLFSAVEVAEKSIGVVKVSTVRVSRKLNSFPEQQRLISNATQPGNGVAAVRRDAARPPVVIVGNEGSVFVAGRVESEGR